MHVFAHGGRPETANVADVRTVRARNTDTAAARCKWLSFQYDTLTPTFPLFPTVSISIGAAGCLRDDQKTPMPPKTMQKNYRKTVR